MCDELEIICKEEVVANILGICLGGPERGVPVEVCTE
jgi:hypothetical protein